LEELSADEKLTNQGGSAAAYHCGMMYRLQLAIYGQTTLLGTNRSLLHGSSYTPKEAPHITANLSTAAAWDLNPRENNACVHIYETPAEGWLLTNTFKNKVSSTNIQSSVIFDSLFKSAVSVPIQLSGHKMPRES
jgi:hypothetical protein